MNYLVSVVIPVFNSERTIVRCLESIRLQTYPFLEVIIVNDGSTDESPKIISEYIQEYKLNWIFLQQKNKGVSSARNNGIINSTGEYISFLDSDDYWFPNKILKQVEFCIKHNAEFICSSIEKSRVSKEYRIINFNQLLFRNMICTSTVLLRNTTLKKTELFDVNKKYSEDYYLWLILAREAEIYQLLDPCIYYNTQTEGLSSKLLEMEKGELNNYSKLFKLKMINFGQYIIISCFSLFKFLKRVVYKLYKQTIRR